VFETARKFNKMGRIDVWKFLQALGKKIRELRIAGIWVLAGKNPRIIAVAVQSVHRTAQVNKKDLIVSTHTISHTSLS
jgi:hypothetical protein